MQHNIKSLHISMDKIWVHQKGIIPQSFLYASQLFRGWQSANPLNSSPQTFLLFSPSLFWGLLFKSLSLFSVFGPKVSFSARLYLNFVPMKKIYHTSIFLCHNQMFLRPNWVSFEIYRNKTQIRPTLAYMFSVYITLFSCDKKLDFLSLDRRRKLWRRFWRNWPAEHWSW